MGVFSKLKSAMGLEKNEAATLDETPRPNEPRDLGSGRLLAEAVAPREPVAIDLTHVDHEHDPAAPKSPGDSTIDFDGEGDGSDEKRLSAKKAKQELITELQKNYKEVLELVRRVQTHLDEQETRSARLMEIVERVPEALDRIPEQREQTERLINAVESLGETAGAHRDVSQQNLRELVKANEQLAQTARAENELVTTMGEFKDAAQGIADQNDRTATAVKDLSTSSSARDKRLEEAIADGRKWLIIGIVATASAAGVAIIIAAIALAS